MIRTTVFAAALAALAAAAAVAQERARVDAARFDDEGRLIYPADVEEWVHLGSNLGLNYVEGDFDPASPGLFGVVTMEPTAYRVFMDTGVFPDGAMFHLSFHGVVRDEELSPGFATGPSRGTEIHLKDSEMFPDGFNFYSYRPGQASAEAATLPNDCVDCHTEHAAHDGVFTQFYPRVAARLAVGSVEN